MSLPDHAIAYTRPWSARLRAPRLTLGRLGAIMLLVFLAVAVLAPLLAPYDPSAYSGNPLERPSAAHWLGTNDIGQDIFSELVYGARLSLLVGIVAGTLTLILAAAVGMFAGYAGGATDVLSMRFVDILMAIPHLPLMILVAAYVGPSLRNIILIVALLGWMGPARVIRSQVLSLRTRSHIHAAQLFGGSTVYVVWRHVMPALGPLLAATFVAQAGRAIAVEAALAFLGLGDPSAKSWGLMMRYALNYRGLYFTPHWIWWLLPAGLCICLLILAFSFLGISLEERLDPRLQRYDAWGGAGDSAMRDSVSASPAIDGRALDGDGDD